MTLNAACSKLLQNESGLFSNQRVDSREKGNGTAVMEKGMQFNHFSHCFPK